MTTPEFTKPIEPDLLPILQMHRRHDGWISFHRKNPGTGEHEDLFSVRARDLDGCFPFMSPLLEQDAYFSVNGFFRGGHGFARNSPKDLCLKRAERKGKSLRWLTACFTDIDCNGLGISTGQAIGAIVDAQDHGHIPPASMLTRSGRGVWAFWFLVDDEDNRKPVRAWQESVRLWVNVQNRIGREFTAIGADANARDPVRITRVPGSVNTKSRRRVNYWIQGDQDGKPFVYRLGEFAKLLGVKVPKRTPKLEARVSSATIERARGAWRGRWINARDNFERLWELRGTFKPGTRNAAVFLYVTFLRGLRLDQDAINAEAGRLFESMEQPASEPFTKADLQNAIEGAKVTGNVRNQTIADRLDITSEESAVLTAGRGWPPASRFSEPRLEDLKLTPAERTRRRRNLLQAKVKSMNKWPGLKWLAEWLADQGLECSFKTVANDLDVLKIRNPKTCCRKPKPAAGPELF